MRLKFTIVPPVTSGKEPFVKEFDSWRVLNEYLRSKNYEIYESDPVLEELNFRPGLIE